MKACYKNPRKEQRQWQTEQNAETWSTGSWIIREREHINFDKENRILSGYVAESE